MFFFIVVYLNDPISLHASLVPNTNRVTSKMPNQMKLDEYKNKKTQTQNY